MAKTAKGEKREFETSAVLWVDLLGYGAMLEQAGWDPTSKLAQAALARIVKFQSIVSKCSMRHFPTFVMNDGAIAHRDLSPRTHTVTYDFLRRAIDLHTQINAADIAAGYPGARAVLAVGFRVRRRVDYSGRLSSGEGLRIKEKLAEQLIGVDQAINHALMVRHHSDSTPELQHNYAMTKAYLAEASGSKAGFSGPRLFVDMNIFSGKVPGWIKFSERIKWAARGMHGTFRALTSVDEARARREDFQGLRDAFEIAQSLSPDPNVLNIIRASRIGDLRK